MQGVQLESNGGVEMELDLENEELRVEGVVQTGDFEEQAQFVLDQMSEGNVERVEE